MCFDNTPFYFARVDAVGCILAAGDINCDSPCRSGKRFKSQATNFGFIDLQFDIVQEPTEDNSYRVFQRFTNSTSSFVKDLELSLGFDVGDDFTSYFNSSALDYDRGFFVPTEAEPPNSQLAALFPAGLFSGDVGYFDDESSGFNLTTQEDLIASWGLSSIYRHQKK